MDLLTFRQEIYDAVASRPQQIRLGQAIFNYIDEVYGVARIVQFIDGIDCFYDDDYIEPFIIASFRQLI